MLTQKKLDEMRAIVGLSRNEGRTSDLNEDDAAIQGIMTLLYQVEMPAEGSRSQGMPKRKIQFQIDRLVQAGVPENQAKQVEKAAIALADAQIDMAKMKEAMGKAKSTLDHAISDFTKLYNNIPKPAAKRERPPMYTQPDDTRRWGSDDPDARW